MNRLTATLCGAILAALPPASAMADTYTYTYTGNDFTYVQPGVPTAGIYNPFTTSDSISGYFTLSTALAPNLSFGQISVDSAVFTDGFQTLDAASIPTHDVSVEVATDSSGNISSWGIYFGVNGEVITTNNVWLEEWDGLDYVVGDAGVTNEDGYSMSANNGDDPGTWTVSTSDSPSPVPEPSGLLLLGTGAIGGLGVFRRKLTAKTLTRASAFRNTRSHGNMYKLTAYLLAAGLTLAASTAVFAQDAPPVPATQVQTQDSAWAWASTDKKGRDDVAMYPSTTGAEHLEIYFNNHEFGRMMVRIPASVQIKDHSKSPYKQVQKNKIEVTLTFDGDAPVSQAWGVVEFPPDAALPAITPQNADAKLYLKALQSKKLTLSYPDVNGNTLTVVFDLSGMKTQMDAHNEKIHHFGVKDGLGILAAAAAGFH